MIRYCAACGVEYRPEIHRCADCGGELELRPDAWESREPDAAGARVDRATTPDEAAGDDYQPVYFGRTTLELEAIAALLGARGIPFRVHLVPEEEAAMLALGNRVCLAVSEGDVAAAEEEIARLVGVEDEGEDAGEETPGM